MKENNPIFALTYAKIPEIFWSDLTSKPFENCVLCETYLLEDGTPYLIEKAFKKYKGIATKSTIFEYAMCFDCYEKMKSKISKESAERLDARFNQAIDFDKRREELGLNRDVDEWIKHCILHKKEATDEGEFQIYAQCDGEDMLYLDMPFMIRGEAVDEMVDLMSAETLEDLGDFMNDLTAGPPEFRALIESGGVKVFV